nr:11-beta-hydroxysteroid dehydrogenase-like 4A [Tanacetum cinerariifolium]
EHNAYEYAKRGASVAIIAIKEPGSRLEQVADRARQLRSPDVLFVFADVSNVEECMMFVNHTIKHFCRLAYHVSYLIMNEVLVFGNGISACSLSARGSVNLEAV